MIIRGSANDQIHEKIFNNAGQVWNHNFFWQCMVPQGGGRPHGALLERIQDDFGSFERFVEQFTAAAKGQFGSGWAWLTEIRRQAQVDDHRQCRLAFGPW